MQQHLSSRSREIDGVHTELAILTYADGILVLVTQLGKVAHFIQASIPPSIPLLPHSISDDGLPLIQPPASIELMSLFGSAPSARLTNLHSLYASHIATLVWTMTNSSGEAGDRRNVIVGLALKKTHNAEGDDAGPTSGERTTFKGVVGMIFDMLRSKES